MESILGTLYTVEILFALRIFKLPCQCNETTTYRRSVKVQCKTLQLKITTEKFKMNIYCVTPSKPLPFSNIDLFSSIDKILTVDNSAGNLKMDRMIVIESNIPKYRIPNSNTYECKERRRVLIDNHISSSYSKDGMLDCNCINKGRRLHCDKINDTTYYNATICRNEFCNKRIPKISSAHRYDNGDILIGEIESSSGVIPVMIQSKIGNFLYMYNKPMINIANAMVTPMTPDILDAITCYNRRYNLYNRYGNR